MNVRLINIGKTTVPYLIKGELINIENAYNKVVENNFIFLPKKK